MTHLYNTLVYKRVLKSDFDKNGIADILNRIEKNTTILHSKIYNHSTRYEMYYENNMVHITIIDADRANVKKRINANILQLYNHEAFNIKKIIYDTGVLGNLKFSTVNISRLHKTINKIILDALSDKIDDVINKKTINREVMVRDATDRIRKRYTDNDKRTLKLIDDMEPLIEKYMKMIIISQ